MNHDQPLARPPAPQEAHGLHGFVNWANLEDLKMQERVFKVAACGTLFVDAYLALACVAMKMMPREFHYYLPPFGFAAVAAVPKLLILIVVAWTTLLAVGCLRDSNRRLQGLDAYVLLMTLLIMLTVTVGFVLALFLG